MKEKNGRYLSKREQQIMEIIYRQGSATAADLEEHLPGKPANSTVRTLLRILEQKGSLRHEEVNGKYTYFATQTGAQAAQQELGKLVDTFFSGSVSRTVAALLDADDLKLTDKDIDEIQQMIQRAREEGR